MQLSMTGGTEVRVTDVHRRVCDDVLVGLIDLRGMPPPCPFLLLRD
jgi:hypothetical protein